MDTSKDLEAALNLLRGLVEFAEIQEREGLIDGAADPELYVVAAKALLAKHEIKSGDEYALSV